MAPKLLFNFSQIDLQHVQYDVAAIEAVNPHRGAMRMLDGLIWSNADFTKGLAFKDVGQDEFWVPGHIPGRPVLPGVFMIEAAAQLASFSTIKKLGSRKFIGFVGLDAVKFRGQVVPGDRLHVLVRQLDFRPRRFICDAQGIVDGNLVFEGRVTGMPI